MGILSRSVLRQVMVSATLGTTLFTFVLFLQKVQSLFGILVRSAAPTKTVGYLFLLVFPYALTFTLPVGVLVGTLLALSRLSSDNEIIGMRACGIPGRLLARPVLLFASLMMLVTAAMTTWLNPWSIRETLRIINQLGTEQVTADIQPRVFDESFPKTVLYVGDVVSGPAPRWRQVFLADTTPPDERQGNMKAADTPRITVTNDAVAVPDVANNRVQLEMTDGRTIEVGANGEYNVISFKHISQTLQASRPDEQRSKPFRNMDMGPLYREAKGNREARIELHQRLALPVACLLLALIGLPLGIASRKGGRSGAVVLTVLIALAYYSALISLIGIAKEGKLPVELAVWLPNGILLMIGTLAFRRLEQAGDRDLGATIRGSFLNFWAWLKEHFQQKGRREDAARELPSFGLVIDSYILSSFLFYFGVLLSSFVLMTHVFTFFELLGDIVRNRIPMSEVLWYHVCLTPKLIYDATPVSVLVGVLVTFGVMAKQNEVTAFKACGISLYRLAAPILLLAVVISGGLFAFDQSIVPPANRIQDALRNKIKGKPVQTYLNPDFPWIRGEGCRVFNYKYLDPTQGVMSNVNVYDLDCASFHVKRHIHAERARWEPAIKEWVFQDGWMRTIRDRSTEATQDFAGGTATFKDISEQPSYFLKEVKQEKQMNYSELADYIHELQKSGFDTIRLQVQYHKKFAVPMFALIMALLAVPFSFIAGNRGAMAGVGVSLGIAVAYWSIGQVFEQVGNLNQLPPSMAAWAPDAVFALVGAYFLARMRT